MATHPKPLRLGVLFISLTVVALVVRNPGIAHGQPDEATFASLDTNQDGVLSGTEAATSLQFDLDQDGEVTKKEYLEGLAAERKRLLAIDDGTLFSARDSNADGVLSGTEIKGFEKYDADGDGEVSRKEFDQGRSAERGPTKNERLAREQFQKLDKNEDGRLSGTETKGYEKLDGNQDGRVTEMEFIEGYQPQAPIDQPDLVFLRMLKNSDPTEFLNSTHAEFVKEVDRPVLSFILSQITNSLGKLKISPLNRLAGTPTTVDLGNRRDFHGTLEYTKGKLEAKLTVIDGRIAGFELKSPLLKDAGQKLYLALSKFDDFSKSVADFYTRASAHSAASW